MPWDTINLTTVIYMLNNKENSLKSNINNLKHSLI